MNIVSLTKEKYGELIVESKEAPGYIDVSDCKDAKLECTNKDVVLKVNDKENYNGTPLFFENQDIHFYFAPNKECYGHDFSLFIRGAKIGESRSINQQKSLSAKYNFFNSVGFTDFTLRNDTIDKDIINIKTEVFPQKIDYKDDFQEMITEITEIIYNLAFDYYRDTYLHTKPRDTYEQSLSAWLVILKRLFDSTQKSIDLIIRSPNHKINCTSRVRNINKVRKVDKSIRKWVLRNRKHITNVASGYKVGNLYFSHLPERKKELSYDTFENQFLKWSIKQIIKKIDELSLYFKNKKDKSSEELQLLSGYKKRLHSRLNDYVFKNVSEFKHTLYFSTVLTMAPGYKDYYKNYLLLRRGLEISARQLFNLDLKDISLLYEYWCFLKMVKILRSSNKYNLENNDFIKLEHNRFVVKLQKGVQSEVVFTKKDTKEKIKVYFNKQFSTDTYSQRPDNFIEFKKNGYKNPFWYFFDAKYRFEKETEFNKTYGPPQDAIGQMHRYRDAILEQKKTTVTYNHAIKGLGGLILFPYPKSEKEYRSHQFYKSIGKVNIGGLPLQPGKNNKLFSKFLDNLFACTPEKIYENIIDYDKDEYKKFLNEVQQPVLIGMIPSNNNSERLNYLNKEKKYYIRIQKNINPVLYKFKNVAIYNQKTKKIIGYYKSTNTYFKNDRGAVKSNPQKDYLFFELEKIKEMDTEFTFGNFGRSGYFFTNSYVFNRFIDGEYKDILKLNNLKDIRKWQETKRKNKKVVIIRKRFKLDKDNNDISDVSITGS